MFFLEFLINVSNEDIPKNISKTSSACYASLFVYMALYMSARRQNNSEIFASVWAEV